MPRSNHRDRSVVATAFSRWAAGVVGALMLLAMPSVAMASSGGSHALPPVWAIIPFVVLLGMIATGPLFYHHFWEHHYPKVSVILGLVTIAFYALVMQDLAPIYHEFIEYVSFLALLSSLFVASGAILIDIDRKGTPLVNVLLLLVGAVLANFIGTTGASMLLIRPFMRINRGRLKAYHVIFFIFLVSNIGGGLTPIGDPPLFMGFLRGVPFFWVLGTVFHIWAFTIALVLAVFFVIDTIQAKKAGDQTEMTYTGEIKLTGSKGFIWLAVIIGAVFLDPNVIPGFPSLQEMWHVPFGIREIIMFAVAFLAYKTANKDALRGNDFNFEPIREVGFLFIGIFITMVPALQLIAYEAKAFADALTPGMFYFGTGGLSAVLDNTPTYINFFVAAMGKYGLDAGNVDHVRLFTSCPESAIYLEAISVAAVFFGALTYIGNGPNFMVKSISDQSGLQTPSFFGYLFKYALPILLPIFIIVWALFYRAPSIDDAAKHSGSCIQIEQAMNQQPASAGGHTQH
jgi:Na+/H+ antiporter NhaD/arsenite permease-like protein